MTTAPLRWAFPGKLMDDMGPASEATVTFPATVQPAQKTPEDAAAAATLEVHSAPTIHPTGGRIPVSAAPVVAPTPAQVTQ